MAHYQICETDQAFSEASIFILDRKRDLHPSFSTVGMTANIYRYITEGRLYLAKEKPNGPIMSVTAYFHGTPESEFADRDVILVDMVIADKSYRGSRHFAAGFATFLDHLLASHPEATVLRVVALTENAYNCRLYSKFMTASGVREGATGQETVFSGRILQIRGILAKYIPV